jgi:hypothetical protein
MVGVGGAVVTLTNEDDTGVVSWEWELLDSPLNSALVPGILGTSASEAFTPDSPETPGCYRVRLTTTSANGAQACDVKNFAVETITGWILPPFKAAAGELNFGGNDEGWQSLINKIFLDIAAGGSSDQRVKVSGSDTTIGFLQDNLSEGSNVSFALLNPGANEQLEVSASDDKAAVSSADTTPSRLEDKVTQGTNVSLTKLNPGLNEQLVVGLSSTVSTANLYNLMSPLSGITDATFNIVGELRTSEFGRAQALNVSLLTYSTVFNVSNHHLSLNVKSLTGTGTATVTGTSVSESDGTRVIGDTEVITIDAVARYQTDKKWWEITSIQFGGGVSAVLYDIEVIGYVDKLGKNFKITGYRSDIYTQSSLSDFGLEIHKVEDLGNKKWQLVTVESIGYSSIVAQQITDNIRTGAEDRSYTPTVTRIVGNDQTLTFKQADFDSYFSSGENVFESSTKNEGFVVHLRGEDGSGGGTLSGVDHFIMSLYINLL